MNLFVIVNTNTKEIARKEGYGPSKLRIYTTENRAKAALRDFEDKSNFIIVEYAPIKYVENQNES